MYKACVQQQQQNKCQKKQSIGKQ